MDPMYSENMKNVNIKKIHKLWNVGNSTNVIYRQRDPGIVDDYMYI